MTRALIAGALCLFSVETVLGQNDAPRAGAGFAANFIEGCQTDLLYLNQVTGWQVNWPTAWRALEGSTEDEYAEAVRYWSQAPGVLNEQIEVLRDGLKSGRGAPGPVVRRVLAQLDGAIEENSDTVPGLSSEIAPGPEARAWRTLFDTGLRPALAGFRAFLHDEYLAAAPDQPGLFRITDGETCYLNAVVNWTTLELSGEEIEAIGRRTIAQLRDELSALSGVPHGELDAYIDTLRSPARAQATTPEALIEISRAAIARAERALPHIVPDWPIGPVEVEAMPVAMESAFPAGFYRPGSQDRPAAYVINRSRPADRRLMAEVIAFHEAVPGHHLQREASRVNGNDGTFNAGHVEGWALYSEYLAAELDLYSSDFDRIGATAKHLWAASRLVIEPRMHLNGWTREQAIEFMMAQAPLSREETELEIDRYIAMPGQSLSYMLGAQTILELRRQARERLGDRFDLREFHAIILDGFRPLGEVSSDVEAWVHARLENPQ